MLPHVVHQVAVQPRLKPAVLAFVGLDLRVRLQVRLEAVLEHEHCRAYRARERRRARRVLLQDVVLAFRFREEPVPAVLAEHRLLLEMLAPLVVLKSVPTPTLVIAFVAGKCFLRVYLAVHS